MISPNSNRERDPDRNRDREDSASVSTVEGGVVTGRKFHSLPRRYSRHSTARRSNSGLWNRLVTNVFRTESDDDFYGGSIFYTDSVNGSNYELSGEVSLRSL